MKNVREIINEWTLREEVDHQDEMRQWGSQLEELLETYLTSFDMIAHQVQAGKMDAETALQKIVKLNDRVREVRHYLSVMTS